MVALVKGLVGVDLGALEGVRWSEGKLGVEVGGKDWGRGRGGRNGHMDNKGWRGTYGSQSFVVV